MPVKLEKELQAQAKKKGFSEERTNRYVYGTLRKTGWKPKREKANKGGLISGFPKLTRKI